MKKLAALLLAIMVVFTLAGCDNGTATVDSSDGVSVEECYWSAIHSKSADEMAAYVSVGDANDYYGNVQNVFGSDTYSVKAEATGHYDGYEVFYITVKSNSDKSKTMSNFELFEKKGNNYYLVLDADTISEINQNCVCPSCAGTGRITTGQNTCGICGGSGHIGSNSFTPCDNCDGRRYVFE